MKTIQLTNSPKVAIVDDEDYERVAWLNWKLHPEGYACSKNTVNGVAFQILLHHAVIGSPLIGIADHRDRNRLNNQKNNLRYCTYRQNAQNCTARRDGLKGVYFNRRSKANPWVAQIVVDGRKLWLGSFPTEEQGHLAYCQAASQYFGDFACYA